MKKLITVLLSLSLAFSATAQNKLTKEQILAMSTDELSELPLEDLMMAVETLGVGSVDELFALIMNKNVSSASKTEESSFTSPLSTTVITHDEMRQWGITTIEEAFRLIPGMIVTEKTNGIYDVQMRGLNNIPDNNMFLYTENSNTLLMIDSRPVHNYSTGALNFEILPIDIEDVERIEVVRGASGALYGANAVTGVINIITRKPDQSQAVVSGNVQMGNLGTYLGSLALRKAVSDKFAFGITANFQRRNRPTSDLYVIPAAGVYYANSDAAPKAGTSFVGEQAFGANLEAYGGTLRDFSAGGWVAPENLKYLKQIYPTEDNGVKIYTVYDCLEPESPASEMFPNSEASRKTEGYNGYLTFTPATDVRIDLTGGYQRSTVLNTPVGDDYFSFNTRQIKTGYVALSADVKGLKVLANYSAGPHNYAVGVPGFKVNTKLFFASAEYDFKVGDLGIRPGVFVQNIYYEDYVPDFTGGSNYEWEYHDPGFKYDESKEHLSGFFNYDARVKDVAPSIRLDYKVNDFRFIAAYRADKTNIPDKWNHSAQVSACWQITPDNFIRVVYGHSNRSANFVNSNANYRWTRTNLVLPSYLTFSKNEDADLVSIDNVEIGYRVKPNTRLLIDGEVFYSVSRDYSSLMANSAFISLDKNIGQALVKSVQDMIDSGEYEFNQIAAQAGATMKRNIDTEASIKCGVLPFDVKQFGVSLNTDWIISSKVIAKLNLNFQKTTIDNYYQYSQTDGIKALLGKAQTKLTEETGKAVYAMYHHVITAEYAIAGLEESFSKGDKYVFSTVEGDLTQALGSDKTEDGVENKATPNFYGMIGVMYKPIEQLNISAFANYIGERTYKTKYNSKGEELGQRFTINLHLGYKPVESCEVFFNAHNLLNNEKREFVYCDEIGGLYTLGVNFDF